MKPTVLLLILFCPFLLSHARRMAPLPTPATAVQPQATSFSQPTLGFSLPLPEGWTVVTKNDQPLALEKPKPGEKPDDLIQASRRVVQRILILQRFPRGTPHVQNTTIVINAIPTGKQVTDRSPVEHQKSIAEKMSASQKGFVLLEEPKELTIGERKFSSMDNRLTLRDKVFHQRHLDRFQGDYILNIQIIASSRQDVEAAELLIKKMTFADKKP